MSSSLSAYKSHLGSNPWPTYISLNWLTWTISNLWGAISCQLEASSCCKSSCVSCELYSENYFVSFQFILLNSDGMLCMHLWDICEALHCLPDGAVLRPGGNRPILCVYPSSESARTSWLLSLYTRSCPENIHECGQGTLVISYPFPQPYEVCSVQGANTDVYSKYDLLLIC